MLDDTDKRRVLDSWARVKHLPVAELFYARLFELEPAYRQLFPEDMASQRKKLGDTLQFMVSALDWTEDQWNADIPGDEDLIVAAVHLGRRHNTEYKIPPESYAVVGRALLDTLQAGLGPDFDEPTRTAWTRLYTAVSRVMR